MPPTWDGPHHCDNVSLGEDAVCYRNVLLRSKNTLSAQLSFVWAARHASCTQRFGRRESCWLRQCSWLVNAVWHWVCQPSEEIIHKPSLARTERRPRQTEERKTDKIAQGALSWNMYADMTLHGARLIHLFLSSLDIPDCKDKKCTVCRQTHKSVR